MIHGVIVQNGVVLHFREENPQTHYKFISLELLVNLQPNIYSPNHCYHCNILFKLKSNFSKLFHPILYLMTIFTEYLIQHKIINIIKGHLCFMISHTPLLSSLKKNIYTALKIHIRQLVTCAQGYVLSLTSTVSLCLSKQNCHL